MDDACPYTGFIDAFDGAAPTAAAGMATKFSKSDSSSSSSSSRRSSHSAAAAAAAAVSEDSSSGSGAMKASALWHSYCHRVCYVADGEWEFVDFSQEPCLVLLPSDSVVGAKK